MQACNGVARQERGDLHSWGPHFGHYKNAAYNAAMSSPAETPLGRLLDPVAKCLTAEVAKQIIELRPDLETQSRIDELATKSNEGLLAPDERSEYEAYVEAIDMISVIQTKSRSKITL